mgnify:CR=1 FL=1
MVCVMAEMTQKTGGQDIDALRSKVTAWRAEAARIKAALLVERARLAMHLAEIDAALGELDAAAVGRANPAFDARANTPVARSVMRACHVLAGGADTFTRAEIVKESGIAASSVSGVLTMLVRTSKLVRVHGGTYALGPDAGDPPPDEEPAEAPPPEPSDGGADPPDESEEPAAAPVAPRRRLAHAGPVADDDTAPPRATGDWRAAARSIMADGRARTPVELDEALTTMGHDSVESDELLDWIRKLCADALLDRLPSGKVRRARMWR